MRLLALCGAALAGAAAAQQPVDHSHHMPQEAAPASAAPPPSAPAPSAPSDRAADRFYPPSEMAAADAALRREHGGMPASKITLDLAEYQIRDGRDGYRWAGEGWFGGDIDRVVVKTGGDGSLGEGVESAEAQLLYSHALDPYWNLQAGVRQDFGPGASPTYAVIGVEGVAPYWVEAEAALFLSDRGDLLGRIEAHYDQRLTQRLILQPRAEFTLSAQDIPEQRSGSGLTHAELGLRLRYEIAREFVPYIGVSHDRAVGGTARLARAAGEDARSTSLVLGVRAWF